jgi:hypothetical protein
MAEHKNLASLFTDIAGAIREKTGDEALIVADNFPQAIAAISTGSPPKYSSNAFAGIMGLSHIPMRP